MKYGDNFSAEAKRELTTCLSKIEELLIEEAKNESLSSRGEPLEITAADVKSVADKVMLNTPSKHSRTIYKLLIIYKYFGYAAVVIAVIMMYLHGSRYQLDPFFDFQMYIMPLVFVVCGITLIILPDLYEQINKFLKRNRWRE